MVSKFGISFCLGTDFQVKDVKLQMLFLLGCSSSKDSSQHQDDSTWMSRWKWMDQRLGSVGYKL